MKEDLHLATPPPHPSEAPVVNPNPLATTPQPATAGTKVSLLSLGPRSSGHLRYKLSSSSSSPSKLHPSIQEHPSEGRASGDLSSDAGDLSANSSAIGTQFSSSAPAFGEGNVSLLPTPSKGAAKRSKPKNNIAKSNSSFISRVIVNETLPKRLQEHPHNGYFAFANINRAFQWLDMSSPTKVC